MTISELQIQLDISSGNEIEVLKQHAHKTSYSGYLFVDSYNGQCYLLDKHGKLDDISKVRRIGNYAFYNCTSLESITIPDSVESIGEWTFGNCTSLREIIFKGKTINQVKAMDNYPWDIKDISVIKCR